MRLKDKIAIITGASRGIGKATAILFAQEGAKVVINYKQDKQAAENVLSAIGKENGILVQADVAQEEDVKKAIMETIRTFGKIDILVNNAGIAIDGTSALKHSVSQWEEVLRINLIAMFLCSKYAAEYLKKSKGAIVNVTSTNGIKDFYPTSVAYDASKAGAMSLTKDLAIELAPEVRVNAVAPGWVKTDMNKSLSKEFLEEEMRQVLLHRIASPEEMAKVILFLASTDASYITGSVLIADGGSQ